MIVLYQGKSNGVVRLRTMVTANRPFSSPHDNGNTNNNNNILALNIPQ